MSRNEGNEEILDNKNPPSGECNEPAFRASGASAALRAAQPRGLNA
jgi:hypothetical protein